MVCWKICFAASALALFLVRGTAQAEQNCLIDTCTTQARFNRVFSLHAFDVKTDFSWSQTTVGRSTSATANAYLEVSRTFRWQGLTLRPYGAIDYWRTYTSHLDGLVTTLGLETHTTLTGIPGEPELLLHGTLTSYGVRPASGISVVCVDTRLVFHPQERLTISPYLSVTASGRSSASSFGLDFALSF